MNQIEDRLAAILEARTHKIIETAFAPLRAELAAISPRMEARIAEITRRVDAVANEAEDDLEDEEDE
jgi:hypothetical protein